MYKKILLAADGSEHSKRTVDHAAQLAQLENGEVTVIYVIDRDQSKSDVLSEGDQHRIKKRRHERLIPIEEMLEAEEISFNTEVLHGVPGPTIVNYANNNHYDIVIIGSRGLNAFQEMVLGSVSHKVAKRADCPVMIIK